MRAIVQRVSQASVSVDGAVVSRIGQGLLVLLGVKHGDTEEDARVLARKVVHLRIFNDDCGRMNRSVRDIGGEILVVSQFTLYGVTSRGNRPSYSQAAAAEIAQPLYDQFLVFCREEDIKVCGGVFRAHMDVALINDGPVTLLCASELSDIEWTRKAY